MNIHIKSGFDKSDGFLGMMSEDEDGDDDDDDDDIDDDDDDDDNDEVCNFETDNRNIIELKVFPDSDAPTHLTRADPDDSDDR